MGPNPEVIECMMGRREVECTLLLQRGSRAELDDQHQVLEGEGHTVRHINTHFLDDLEKIHAGSHIRQLHKLEEEKD